METPVMDNPRTNSHDEEAIEERSPTRAFGADLSAVIGDVARIFELQGSLLVLEMRDAGRRAVRNIALVLLAIGMLVSGGLIALAALGLLIADLAHWSPAQGLLCIAVISAVFAGGLMWWVSRRYRADSIALASSAREFQSTWHAISNALSAFVEQKTSSPQD